MFYSSGMDGRPPVSSQTCRSREEAVGKPVNTESRASPCPAGLAPLAETSSFPAVSLYVLGHGFARWSSDGWHFGQNGLFFFLLE